MHNLPNIAQSYSGASFPHPAVRIRIVSWNGFGCEMFHAWVQLGNFSATSATRHTKNYAVGWWPRIQISTYNRGQNCWDDLLLPPPPEFNVERWGYRSRETTQLCAGGGGGIITFSYMINSSVWEWICSKSFVRDNWLRGSIPTNLDKDCSYELNWYEYWTRRPKNIFRAARLANMWAFSTAVYCRKDNSSNLGSRTCIKLIREHSMICEKSFKTACASFPGECVMEISTQKRCRWTGY